AGVHQVRPRTPASELPRIRGVSLCERRGNQEGAPAEGGVLDHARPDAVTFGEPAVLDVDDIQHILLTRVPALTGRYEFLSFSSAAGGRAWLSALLPKVQSAAEVRASTEMDNRWVSVAFTWNGLRALGLDEDSLAT